MNKKLLVKILVSAIAAIGIFACAAEKPVDIDVVLSTPKAFVGSETCKKCHLEHYDSWKMTMHSRMTKDAQKNRDVIIAPIDEKRIRKDLAKLSKKLKVPAHPLPVMWCSLPIQPWPTR